MITPMCDEAKYKILIGPRAPQPSARGGVSFCPGHVAEVSAPRSSPRAGVGGAAPNVKQSVIGRRSEIPVAGSCQYLMPSLVPVRFLSAGPLPELFRRRPRGVRAHLCRLLLGCVTFFHALTRTLRGVIPSVGPVATVAVYHTSSPSRA